MPFNAEDDNGQDKGFYKLCGHIRHQTDELAKITRVRGNARNHLAGRKFIKEREVVLHGRFVSVQRQLAHHGRDCFGDHAPSGNIGKPHHQANSKHRYANPYKASDRGVLLQHAHPA